MYTLTNAIEIKSNKDTNEAISKCKYVDNCKFVNLLY